MRILVNCSNYITMMKRILMIVCMIVAVMQGVDARSVVNPPVKFNSTDKGNNAKVSICGVDLLNERTVVRMKVEFKPGWWIYISKNTILKTGSASLYVTDASTIKIGEQLWMPESGILEFELVFLPIPETTKKIDIIESDGWQFLGIDLTDGAGREQSFSQFGNSSNYEYVYYSPLMLRTLSAKTVQNIPVEKLNRLEMVTTRFDGNSSKLRNAIRDVIAYNDMELVSKEDGGSERSSEFYAVLDASGKQIKKMLIAQYGAWRNAARILYIEGNFSTDELKDFIATQKEAAKKL